MWRRGEVDRYERIDTIGTNKGDKKRDKIKTKQINSTLLSFAYICTKEGRLLHNTIYLYNIYHVTAVHLPSNHSHRDIRSKTKDIHIYLKIKKKQKKKYTDTRIASMSRSIDSKKKRKEKGQHLKRRASARIISLLIYLVASLDWSAGRKLIDEMYCLCYTFMPLYFLLSLCVHTHKDRISF